MTTPAELYKKLMNYHMSAPGGEPLIITEDEVDPLAEYILSCRHVILNGDKKDIVKRIKAGAWQMCGRTIHVV